MLEQPPSANPAINTVDNGTIRGRQKGEHVDRRENREKTVVRIDEARSPSPKRAKAGYDCLILV